MTPRTPIFFVKMTMDYCSNTFGVAPCTATGTKCYNTFPTCKDKVNFSRSTRDYKFTSSNAPPCLDNARPYVRSVKLLSTEIKTNLTISGRVSIEMEDEPDGDVGIDPYVTGRAAFPNIPGTFWKKFLVRNRNFRTRKVCVYEGWLGDAEGDFVLKWTGSIENVTRSGQSVKLEAADVLASLSNIEVPAKVDIKLLADITDSQTEITVNNFGEGLDDGPSYLKIGSEIVSYESIDRSNGIVSGVVRGRFDTAPESSQANAKVGKVRYFAPGNAFDHMKSMLLTDAGIAAGNVDSVGIDAQRDLPWESFDMWAIVDEPTKLNELFFELVDLLDCKAWVTEAAKITVRRNIPSDPDRELTLFSDDDNIIHRSAKYDGNEKSRITRFSLYWDRPGIGKMGEPASFRRMDMAIEADSESASGYGDVVEKKLFTRWLHSDGFMEEEVQHYAKTLVMRRVWRDKDASPIIPVEAELKDAGLNVGNYVLLSTDEDVNADGTPISGAQYQVVKREAKGNRVALSLLRIMTQKTAYIHATVSPNQWGTATDEEQKYAYFAYDEENRMSDGTDGYHIF